MLKDRSKCIKQQCMHNEGGRNSFRNVYNFICARYYIFKVIFRIRIVKGSSYYLCVHKF